MKKRKKSCIIGETFVFHGDGTASVKGPFGENLGRHLTNHDNPSPYQNIALVVQGCEKRIFVGMGLRGGIGLAQWIKSIGLESHHYAALKKAGYESVSSLEALDEGALYFVCTLCEINGVYREKFFRALGKKMWRISDFF